MKNLFSQISICQTEEEVKSEFIKFFGFKLQTKQRIDHYSPEVLYEFKCDKKFSSKKVLATVLAQTLYYIRELKYGTGTRPVPPNICGVDKNEAFIAETVKFKCFYEKRTKEKYDWDRAPSVPCPILVEDLANCQELAAVHVYSLCIAEEERQFVAKLKAYQARQFSLFDSDKKQINEENFAEVFSYWKSLFGHYVENGKKPSEYFICDIENGKSTKIENSKVVFDLGDGNAKIKPIPFRDYDYFWGIYEKVCDSRIIYAIRQKIDRLSEDFNRRFTGEFYTPIPFASKAFEYIEKVVGKNWWESGEYRLWDMAAGTGNLEFCIPSNALQYCYVSTLLEDDANYCRRIFPGATVFQYDYLNDDINVLINKDLFGMGVQPKMPKQLVEDLANPKIKWIIFINPPFATSNSANLNGVHITKDNVSRTLIQKEMEANNLGETSRELFAQFLYRINAEFRDRTAYLGLFSTLKYINANNDQKLRDNFFRYEFLKGFMFSSESFVGSKGKFPVGFVLWDTKKNKPLENQKIVLDVYDSFAGKIGFKEIKNDKRNSFLSKWATRPEAKNIFPPFKSAITLGDKNADVRDRVAAGFLASFMCNGNDFQQSNLTAFLSGPAANAGGYSVVAENFEKSMIYNVVRKLPKADWTNNRDQFYQPTAELPEEFVNDCVVWSLFADDNNTVSIKEINYKDKKYEIRNNFYPFSIAKTKEWKCLLSEIFLPLISANEDRFAAVWLSGHSLSSEAQNVFRQAESLYRLFYENAHQTRWMDYRISSWDVGYWQIKKALSNAEIGDDEMNALKAAHKALGEKLLPQLYSFGFLPEEVCYFADGSDA